MSDPQNIPKIKCFNLFIFYIRIRFQKATNDFSILIISKSIEESHIFGQYDQIRKFGPRPPKMSKNQNFQFIHILHQNTLPISYYTLLDLNVIKSYELFPFLVILGTLWGGGPTKKNRLFLYFVIK